MTVEATRVVELTAVWLVFVTFMVAWRLEGLFDRVDVLERLAHPPSRLCSQCRQPVDAPAPATNQPKEATR